MDDGGRVDVVAALEEGQDALPRPGRWSRRGAGWQAKVGENLVSDERILDAGDELHAAVAARTVEHIEAPGSGHQARPIEATLAGGVVGGVGVRW